MAWISVDERLPKDGQKVLYLYDSKLDSFTVGKGYKPTFSIDFGEFEECEQYGNNKRPYCFKFSHGNGTHFGQCVRYWQPVESWAHLNPTKVIERNGYDAL